MDDLILLAYAVAMGLAPRSALVDAAKRLAEHHLLVDRVFAYGTAQANPVVPIRSE